MKNVGIVRRLDELGRIVIPREFRKTHRINVGDPLEIMATESGNIIITKVDTISDLTTLCETACASLAAELSMTIAGASFDKILAASGQGRSILNDKELSSAVSKMLKSRGFFSGAADSEEILGLVNAGFNFVCVVPIQSYDDCFGGLIAFSNKEISGFDAAALKLAGRLVGDTLAKY
ncbi:MAG: AbrB/MazE/SpoVT family DNA-binding domain-containing protein [Firmicutes bacterium]|nr:AbrB/MazE/SpoVT family DNA-binding domain-containing protein [Bacillota bacterium]